MENKETRRKERSSCLILIVISYKEKKKKIVTKNMAPSFSSLGRHSTGKYSISPQGKHFCLLSFFSFLNPSKIDFSQPTKVNSREKRKKMTIRASWLI
jgi:hypothetical protein